MYACSNCRRILNFATRNAVCLRCLGSLDRDAFADEETKPNIVPLSLESKQQRAHDARGMAA